MKKHTTQAYKGYETWLSIVLMNIKMLTHLGLVSAVLSVILTIIFISTFGSKDLFFFRIPSKETWDIIKLSLENIVWGFSNHHSAVTEKGIALLKEAVFSFLPYLVTIFFLIFGGFLQLGIKIFRRRSGRQQEDFHLAGSQLVSSEEIKKELRKVKTSIPIGDLEFPVEDETKHFMIVGRTGSGKTQALKRIVTHLKSRGAKMIIYDNKGDYLPTHYDPKRDLIFNPLDSRSVNWTIFNDCDTRMDIEQVLCHGLIPGTGGSRDPFWANSAREVLKGILYYCYRNKLTRNADIWNLISAGAREIVKVLGKIPEGRSGREMILDSNSRQTQGIISMLLQYVSVFELMAAQDGDFSIRKWLGNNEGGTLFLVNHSKSKDVLKPILTLLVDMASHEVLSKPDDLKRRIYFFLDELGSLNYMSSIIELLTRARSKGASVWIGTQEIGQIDQVYGRELRASIVNGCASKLILAIAEPETAKYFSDAIGQTEILESNETMSMGPSDIREGQSFTKNTRIRPLVLPSEFEQFRDLHGILKMANRKHCHIDIPVFDYKARHNYLEIRDEMILNQVLTNQAKNRETVQSCADVLRSSDLRSQMLDLNI